MMYTFLPLADFRSCAEVLDDKTLDRQRSHAKALIIGLVNGWPMDQEPFAYVWHRNISALMRYHDVVIDEWIRRGYKNRMPRFNERAYTMPIWFGDDQFHSRHRAALLHMNPEHYRKFDWKETPGMNFLWPNYVT